ncbi:MAG: FAD-dependent oxidoreductase [Candidatus Spechtbacterales bacterium]
MYDVVIIGGGPAGAAAAVYAARKRLKSVLVTDEWGGQSTVSPDVQNWIGTPHISGPGIAEQLKKHVAAYANEVLDIVEPDRVVAVEAREESFVVKTEKGQAFKTRTVLVTSGSRRRKLKVPGAEEFDNKGISYCASCDAPLFGDKDVAVIGGGNAGFESAQQLLEYATSVTLLERGEAFKADELTIEKVLKSEKMKALTGVEVKEIKGSAFVESVVYATSDGQEHEQKVGGVFVEIGSLPNSEFIKDLVERNEMGEIKANPYTQRTSREGIWAAGDVSDVRYKQNNISMGDAVKALEDIYLYVQKHHR